GEVQVRSHSTPPPYYRPRYVRPVLVTNDILRSADIVASSMRTIVAQQGSYARLKRGLMAAWFAGMQERYGDARLHQFVRATEALIKPRIGETKRNFKHRGQLFLGSSAQNEDLLEELFDLRSVAEHLNDFESVLDHILPIERERHAWLSSYQAEALAGSVYVRVLSDGLRLRAFENDASIDGFWQLPEGERRDLWGPPLDIHCLTAERCTIEPEPGPTVLNL